MLRFNRGRLNQQEGVVLKFLADVNIEKSIVDELRKLGYDIGRHLP